MASVATRLPAQCSDTNSSEKVSNHPLINVFFRFVDGKNLTLSVSPETEIADVKTLLVQKVTLMHAASATTKHKTTDHNDIFQVFLRLFWMTTAVLSQQAHHAKTNDLVFVWNGKPLGNDCTLTEYQVPSGAVVHVSGRVRGGCFMISASVFCMLCLAVLSTPCTCGISLFAVPFLLPLLFILPLFCL